VCSELACTRTISIMDCSDSAQFTIASLSQPLCSCQQEYSVYIKLMSLHCMCLLFLFAPCHSVRLEVYLLSQSAAVAATSNSSSPSLPAAAMAAATPLG